MALISLYVAALLVMGVVRVSVHVMVTGGFDGAWAQLWQVWLQIMDIGSMEGDSGSPVYNKIIGVTTAILGLTLISTMLAFVTSVFKEKLEDLRKGRSAVIESDHTLILGFGNRALEIIRELVEANESEPDAAVVVLSETEKEVMDDFFNDTLTYRATTRVITRSGNISSPQFLRRMGVTECKSVILLNQVATAASAEEKNQADYRVLKAIMAIFAALGESHDPPPVIAQLHYRRHRDLASAISPGNIIILDEETILSKILVQTSRSHGLSLVYSDLVGFVGNEVYFSKPPEFLLGKSFGSVSLHFEASVPFGLKDLKGNIVLNPPVERTLEAGEELIILAEDDSTIKYHPAPVSVPQHLTLSGMRGKTRPERFLIYGWGKKSPILIREYASYLQEGSEIRVVVKRLTPPIQAAFDSVSSKYPEMQITLEEVHPSSSRFPQKLDLEGYDDVIILAGTGENIETIDAETISLLLKFRHHFKRLEEAQGRTISTKLISEVMDSENLEIIQQTGVKDFLISNQFISKIMAQISEEPDVYDVYEDLFRADGSEIYLKPLSLYLAELPGKPLTFVDLFKAAQVRGEICFGVQVTADAERENRGIYIIPPKSQCFEVDLNDHLIVLAPDEQ